MAIATELALVLASSGNSSTNIPESIGLAIAGRLNIKVSRLCVIVEKLLWESEKFILLLRHNFINDSFKTNP